MFALSVLPSHLPKIVFPTPPLSLHGFESSADPEGGTGGPDPPWDLSEVGSCVEVWWIGEGVQRLCLPYYCHFFWLASLASIIQTYYMYTYFQVQYSVLNGHLFSNIPLIQIMKRIQLPISCFYERAFSYFSRLKLPDFTQFKSKILWGRTPRPPFPRYIYNIKNYYVICVVV